MKKVLFHLLIKKHCDQTKIDSQENNHAPYETTKTPLKTSTCELNYCTAQINFKKKQKTQIRNNHLVTHILVL